MNKRIWANYELFNSIKFRYYHPSMNNSLPMKMKQKMIVDSYYPYTILKNIKNHGIGELSRVMENNFVDGYAISELVSNDLGIKKLHISDLATMLGYTRTDITKMLSAIKREPNTLVLVGYGGTGSNFMHFLHEMCAWTGVNEVFKNIEIYDDDVLEVPNVIRMPYIPEMHRHNDPEKVYYIPKRFSNTTRKLTMYAAKLDARRIEGIRTGFNKSRLIFYGAPDMETRELLQSIDVTFVAGTHQESRFALRKNPVVDRDLILEAYGKINLSAFFIGQLKMTIEFLMMFNSIELSNDEQELLAFDFYTMFSDECYKGFKSGKKKLYLVTPAMQNEQNILI